MPLTPQDIDAVRFSKPPIGKRGYNEDEVDAFLDLVHDDYAEVIEEVDLLRNEVDNLRSTPAPVAAPPAFVPPAPPPPAPEAPSATASRILELAERTAEEVTREAQTEAERVLREARDKAADITGEARYESSKLVDSARTEEAAIRRRIETLREFEDNYRGRLDTYITTQLEALRADAKVEPAS